MWGEFNRAIALPGFKGFYDHFIKELATYEKLCESPDPNEFPLPTEANLILNPLRKLIMLRVLRPDKLVPALSNFVVEQLGSEFTEPPPFDLTQIYKDSSNAQPLIFILSPGSDPLNSLVKFADQKKRHCETVSLGQGQGPKATESIKNATK